MLDQDIADVRTRPGTLQDDLMRFEGRFSSRIATAFAPWIASADPELRRRALQDQHDFMAAALDIAVGAVPEVDLIDMVTLVYLGRHAMARRWPESEYGVDARGVVDAFTASYEDILAVARTVVSPEDETRLRAVVKAWKDENPELENVATVRLSAGGGGLKGGPGLRRDTSGLFSTMRGAARTADSVVMLGERALYAAQRLPPLLRMQTRLAGGEIGADTSQLVTDVVRRTSREELRGLVDHATKRLAVALFLAGSGVAIVAALARLLFR